MINSVKYSFIFLSFFLLPLYCGAQFAGNIAGPEFSLELQPAYPSPGEVVTVTLKDLRNNDVGSEINWYLDDRAIPEAKNQREVRLNAGEVGKTQIVRVSSGGISASAQIRPLYLDIIVEPQTHVPHFYQGRPLPSLGSAVNLTALLSDGSMLSNNLLYSWRVGDVVLEGGAIRGRNKISFFTPMGETIIISVQVSQIDGTMIARRSFTIPSVLPQLRFYEVNTLYGVSKKAIAGTFSLIGNSATVVASPYYLDSKVFNNPDISTWSINGSAAPATGNNPYEVTLQRTGLSGSAILNFHVRSTDIILQGARGSITTQF